MLIDRQQPQQRCLPPSGSSQPPPATNATVTLTEVVSARGNRGLTEPEGWALLCASVQVRWCAAYALIIIGIFAVLIGEETNEKRWIQQTLTHNIFSVILTLITDEMNFLRGKVSVSNKLLDICKEASDIRSAHVATGNPQFNILSSLLDMTLEREPKTVNWLYTFHRGSCSIWPNFLEYISKLMAVTTWLACSFACFSRIVFSCLFLSVERTKMND